MTPSPIAVEHALTLEVVGIGPVELRVNERGAGRPYLLLHGGGGPRSMIEFAGQLAAEGHAHVLAPTHPGFDATPRPDALRTVRGLAATYRALLDHLDLRDVLVVGNSMGGWIAAELALLGGERISGIVLLNAVGIDVPEHPIPEFSNLTPAQIAGLSYHQPDRFTFDPASLPEAAHTILAANRAVFAVYSGQPPFIDGTLRGRLADVKVPALVLWGDSDGMVVPDYGRVFAAAIPDSRFLLLTATGHVPQVESPRQVLAAISDFTSEQPTVRHD